MEFVGADPDLRAETELPTIGKPRGRIPIDRRAIDLREIALRRRGVRGDDRIAVMRAVRLGVFDRLVGTFRSLRSKACKSLLAKSASASSSRTS